MQLLLCLATFVTLVAWAVVFRHTGDFDASGHYLNARNGWGNPGGILAAWDRPIFKLYLLVPAHFGVLAARVAMALLSTIVVWQTVELARDLRLTRPVLAAALVVLQPMVFGLASDTMSEMPMALGIVVAIRLWWRGFIKTSCVLVSLLPMVRPEGFWLCAVWGVMVLFRHTIQPPWKRPLVASTLGVGVAMWCLACWYWHGDPLYFVKVWSWPAQSYETYGRGSLLHHVVRWPLYAGLVLTVLFVAGIRPSWRREMAVPWAVWLVVFVGHSVLYWRGWFASIGFMRIMATTSPVTAVICLYGWHAIAARLTARGWSIGHRRALAYVALVLATALLPLHYLATAQHHRTFPMRAAVATLRDRGVVEAAPHIVAGDEMVLAELHLPPRDPRVVKIGWDKTALRERLATLPVGTVGVWDNQRSSRWYEMPIDDLRAMGYEVLEEHATFATRLPQTLLPLSDWFEYQRYYAIRKTR